MCTVDQSLMPLALTGGRSSPGALGSGFPSNSASASKCGFAFTSRGYVGALHNGQT